MEFVHESNKIYLANEEGNSIAEVTFPTVKEQVVNVNHTYVDDSLRGQGIAGQLMQELVQQLKAENKKAVLSCSYAVMWFDKNKQYEDLVYKD